MKKSLLCSILFSAILVIAGCAIGSDGKKIKPNILPLDQNNFVRIPSGCFHMGSEYHPSAKLPEICVDAFYIKKTEITQKEYKSLTRKSFWSADCKGFCYGVGDSLPVYYINWYDAILFCNQLSKSQGFDTVYRFDSVIVDSVTGHARISKVEIQYNVFGYRLPTDAEWEYACKAGTHDDYIWGDNRSHKNDSLPLLMDNLEDISSMEPGAGDYAWYFRNSGGRVHPVAEKKPNKWGLYDMIGNVLEWCNDWYTPELSNAIRKNPTGPLDGSLKVVRGGSAIKCNNCEGGELKYTTWYRDGFDHDEVGWPYPIGFRVILSIQKK